MLNEPIKTEKPATHGEKSLAQANEQKKATEDQVVDNEKRKDYDVQTTHTKVIPSQK